MDSKGSSNNNNRQGDNLAALPAGSDLSARGITSHLARRYLQYPESLTYTAIGSRVLISINPLSSLNSAHDSVAQKYVDDYRDTSPDRRELPPHIFKVAEEAYLHMRQTGINQSLVFCGETGSGKSEQRRLAMRLFSLIRSQSKKDTKLYQRIQCADIVLEAFSHAKTVEHNNASRVGVYYELQYDRHGRTCGINSLAYLLEKSRISATPPEERNFHIFYYLTNGVSSSPELRQAYGLLEPGLGYSYLSRPGAVRAIPGFDDAEQFQELTSAMSQIGLNSKYQARIFGVIAAILNISNLQFENEAHEGPNSVIVKNHLVLEHIANQLGVEPLSLEDVLTKKTQRLNRERYTAYLDHAGAEARRDDLARSLYGLLFNWLVEFINNKLASPESKFVNYIGLVDLPGFQQFGPSNFESLCVNYANERIHNFFLAKSLGEGNVEYRDEGLADMMSIVDFDEDLSRLDAYVNPKYGLFAIMDRQANEINGKTSRGKKKDKKQSQREFDPTLGPHDASLQLLRVFNRYQREFHDSPSASPVKFSESKNTLNNFTIQHYWGDVSYAVGDFTERNVDALSTDFVMLFRGDPAFDVEGSKNGFIAGLFNDKSVITESDNKTNNSGLANAQNISVPVRQPSRYSKKPNQQAPSSSRTTKKVSCVATQFFSSINDLFSAADETLPWFVLCFRPNSDNRPQKVDENYLLTQVQAYRLDAVAHRKVFDFSASMRHADFCRRYEQVFKQNLAELGQYPDDASRCDHLRIALGIPRNEMVLGATKVFLSYAAWRRIEDPVRAEERNRLAQNHGGDVIERTAAGTAAAAAVGAAGVYEGSGDSGIDPDNNEYSGRNTSIISGPSYGGGSGLRSEDNLVLGAQPPGVYSSSPVASPFPTNGLGNLPHPRITKLRALAGANDTRSFYSDDDYHDTISRADDLESERGGGSGPAVTFNNNARSASNTLANINSFNEKQPRGSLNEKAARVSAADDDEDADDVDSKKKSSVRRTWLWFVWAMTFWVPSPLIKCCAKRRRKDERIAWREKLALCMMIFFSCLFIVFWIAIFGLIICPRQHVFSNAELQEHKDDAYIAVRGEVFDIKDYSHFQGIDFKYLEDRADAYFGRDLSNLFPLQLSFVCPGFNIDPRFALQEKPKLYSPTYYHDHRYWRHSDEEYGYNYYQYRIMRILRENYAKGHIGYEPRQVKDQANGIKSSGGTNGYRYWVIYNNDIFDLTNYITLSGGGGVPFVVSKEGTTNSTNTPGMNFLDTKVVQMFKDLRGQDVTKVWDNMARENPRLMRRHYQCLRAAYYAGIVDNRKSARCYVANYLLLAGSVIIVAIIFFKFIASLQLTSRREPEERENFVILNVPCYTEGEESLRKTINSLTSLKYDDKRKLMFIICDGMIMGSGNDIPTPRIVLNILGVEPDQDPEPLSYLALGEGRRQHNMAKVYSGLTEHSGHVVPYLVVVKCGTPDERDRPGNRGKRDSQIMLMHFFNKVHFDLPMTPLELEIYHQIKNVIGVDPNLYEFVLMIDADTYVFPDSLIRLVSSMVHDSKTMGICGETQLANAKRSWITMMQVYEYFISHHMAKSFESLFGSVTCLPGCFCMYRLKSPDNKPLLIAKNVIEDYSINVVDTLHKKNLLHLGEDRYLTTLMLKHFPYYKNKFTPSAQCRTNAPDSWKVLLSQRRRWINSTVHNLFELVFLPHLCGFCCFSMRFIVIVDLISTMVMPATVLYLAYLIYQLTNPDSLTSYISLYLLIAIYGLQALVFILRRQWQHIGWMIVYILAIPLFAFIIPIYSFWHFDDFSWGKTRVIIGESGRKHVYVVDDQKFDPSTIPVRKWSEYEKEVLWEAGTQSHLDTDSVSQFGGAMSVARPGSAVGNYPKSMSRFFENNTASVYMDGLNPFNVHDMTNMTIRGQRQSTFDYMGGVGTGRMTPVQQQMPMGPSDTLTSYELPYFTNPQQTSSMYNPQFSMPGSQPQTFSPLPQMAMDTMSMPFGGGGGMLTYSNPSPVPAGSYTSPNGAAQWPSGVSDEQITQEIVHIIETSDLMTITKKQVREQVFRHFNIGEEEARARRKFINEVIENKIKSL